jgi:hypothetical protein
MYWQCYQLVVLSVQITALVGRFHYKYIPGAGLDLGTRVLSHYPLEYRPCLREFAIFNLVVYKYTLHFITLLPVDSYRAD